MKVHTVILFALILACLFFAHGCKGTDYGSDGWQSLWQWAVAAALAIFGYVLFDAMVALFFGIAGGALTSAVQNKQPFVSPGAPYPEAPPYKPTLTADPTGWLDRFLDVLWSGLWLVLVVLVIGSVVWHYRRSIWNWLRFKRTKKAAQ